MRKERQSSCQCRFTLLGSTSVKAVRRTLMKLTVGDENHWMKTLSCVSCFKRISSGQHESDDNNQMIRLTYTYAFCLRFRCIMGPVVYDYNKKLILLSAIQLTEGIANFDVIYGRPFVTYRRWSYQWCRHRRVQPWPDVLRVRCSWSWSATLCRQTKCHRSNVKQPEKMINKLLELQCVSGIWTS